MFIELAFLSGAAYWLTRPYTKIDSAKQNAYISNNHLIGKIQSILQLSDQQRLQRNLAPALQKSQEEKRKSNMFNIRVGWVALSGSLLTPFFPLLTLPTIIAILYRLRSSFRLISNDFKRGRYLGFFLVQTILNITLIATGHLILAAISSLIFSFFSSVISQLEDNANEQLIHVFGTHPKRVWVYQGGSEIEIDFHAIKVGDQVIVTPGEIVPVDGEIIRGFGQVDQHILTGESQPVDKAEGHSVFASTLLISGRLIIKVTTAGDDSIAAKITQVLNQTKNYKDTLTLRGRDISDRFIPVSIGLSAFAWPFFGINTAQAIMWANLGKGLSFTGPMAVLTYLQLLARKNILMKDGRVFESIKQIDTLVFDKTGTLTKEQPTLSNIHPFNGFAEQEVLTLAAAAEVRQTHPIAQAILARAKQASIELPDLDELSYEIGFGIKVRIEDQWIRVGSARYLSHEGIVFPQTISNLQKKAEAASHSLTYVSVDEKLAGVLEMQPTIRPEAEQIVKTLQQRGCEIYIISGDHEAPTRHLAEQLGIKHYFAETLPEHKAKIVKQLREEGRFICFVGDGINDAIALKTAQVSVSLKGASTAATDTAQIIFMDGSLERLPELFHLVDKYEATLQRAIIIGFAPGIFTIIGAFFWHFSIAISLMILYINMILDIINCLWPMLKNQPELPEPNTQPTID